MPLPEEQLRRLDEDLQTHRTQREEARQKRDRLTELVAGHDTVVELGGDAKLRGALSEIYDDPDIAAEIANDPASYFRRKGVRVPPGARVRVTQSTPRATTIEAVIRQGRFHYKLVWDRGKGFSAEPEE